MPAKKTAPAKKAAKAAPKKSAPAKKTAPAKKAAPAAKAAAPAKRAAKATEAVVDKVADVTSPEQFVDFLKELRDLIDAKLADAKVEAKAAKRGGKHAAPEPVEEDDDSDEYDEDARRAELNAMKIPALRELASDAGYEDEDVAKANKAQLIDAIVDSEMNPDDDEDDEDADEDEDESEDDDTDDDDDEDSDEEDEDESDDEDEDDDEEEEEDEEEELDRDALNGMGLRELKKLAQSDPHNFDAADLKGKDKDTIIDMLLGEDADEDDEDEDEDEDDYYTVEELAAMPEPELKALAKEWKVKLPPKATKKQIVKILSEVE